MSGPDKAPMDPEARRTRQQQVLLFSGVGETAANLLQAPARTTSDGAVNVSSLARISHHPLGGWIIGCELECFFLSVAFAVEPGPVGGWS